MVINGWSIFAHPLFVDQLNGLAAQVERLRRKDPRNYKKKNATKRLAAISKLAFEDIPRDPSHPKYRLGSTLGDERRHWFRAKFFQQYRLFFRFHRESKIIVYAWVNDDRTKRAYGSRSDAYRTFVKMLDSGHPPDDWNTLLEQAKKDASNLEKTDSIRPPELS